MGLYVLKLTGSGMSFATTLMFGVLAVVLFNPPAGVIADRFNKKHLVVLMDVFNGLLFISLFIVSKSIGLNLILIYLSTFMTTGLTTIFSISFDTAIPHIVSTKQLLHINSIGKIIDSLGSIIGPILGGMIYAFVNIELFILVNGISFLISAIFESLIDFNFNKPKNISIKEPSSFVEDFKSGIRYIAKEKDLVLILVLFVSINFFISFSITVPLPYIITQELNLSSSNYGLIESFFPIGMIIGAGIIKYVIDKIEYTQLLKLATLLLSCTMVIIGLPLIDSGIQFNSLAYLIYFSTCTFIFGITISFIDIPIMYYLQTVIPDHIRGRVLSISIASAKIIAPIALIISGLLIDNTYVFVLPIAGGILLFIGTLYIMSRKVKLQA
jgi:MFS family permease